MPRRKAAWASWVYVEERGQRKDRIDLTYWMNSLQPIPKDDPLFITLNSNRHIREELALTPISWQDDYSVYRGATFNLGHNIAQMMYWRPRNKFEEVDHCYLTGGGTHPGSGLPTIYQSGRIAANLITGA